MLIELKLFCLKVALIKKGLRRTPTHGWFPIYCLKVALIKKELRLW